MMAVGPSFLLAHGTTICWNQSLETKRKYQICTKNSKITKNSPETEMVEPSRLCPVVEGPGWALFAPRLPDMSGLVHDVRRKELLVSDGKHHSGSRLGEIHLLCWIFYRLPVEGPLVARIIGEICL